MRVDYTVSAVMRQTAAMGCRLFDVCVLKLGEGGVYKETVSNDAIRSLIPRLKMDNARGRDVYIRPSLDYEHGLILMDDLSADLINTMKKSRMVPACVVESSPENYQIWVKLPFPLPHNLRGKISRLMASKFGSDPNSADYAHLGRLAGFRNHKAIHHAKYGRAPWVLCRDSSGLELSKEFACRLMSEAESILQPVCTLHTTGNQVSAIVDSPVSVELAHMCFINEFRKQSQISTDLSVCDFRACMTLAISGFSIQDTANALLHCSPNINIRKAGHVDNYVNRTVNKAFSDPFVQAERLKISRYAQHQDDFEFVRFSSD
ncbi:MULTISPECIES: DNA-primase RepB domain-containing protein [unclassified Anaerobiospirillum]|uniref:DNA-primase RepB domain-containing protein n=1 Tax=unclassified Anaerobiospirillum TaxID=2647410 RepID=UPI001FF19AAE|nr:MULTISPECIES: DNA-primase RepB domain-containing protein [unclassified Anaerobiospirillum]MCK0536081.1 RepB family DNA primase [Anaerobiospirillum sp. NML120511]MCK0541114.1 RepB family DNA primase [Anaerobiospirillum sp. NML02-A-032]